MKAFKLLMMLTILAGCGENSEQQQIQSGPAAESDSAVTVSHADGGELKAAILELTQARHQNLCQASEALRQTTETFIQKPHPSLLGSLKDKWIRAHQAYLQTIILTAASEQPGPTGKIAHSFQVRVDQSPMIPGYLDAVPGYPNSGLVYSELPFDLPTLEEQHQFADRYFVAIGFHALEFMIWGTGESAESDPKTLPARFTRNPDDEIEVKRRLNYMRMLAISLDNDLQRLCSLWLPSGERHRWLNKASSSAVSVWLMHRAQESLSILINERLEHASPEEPQDWRSHSEFSRNDRDDTLAQAEATIELFDLLGSSQRYADASADMQSVIELIRNMPATFDDYGTGNATDIQARTAIDALKLARDLHARLSKPPAG